MALSVAVGDANNTACYDYIMPIYQNEELTTSLCTDHSMTDPDSIKFYINVTWYLPEDTSYYETFKKQSKMSDSQIE